MTKAEIKKMSVLEKLHVMEELWDSLSNDENEVDSPEWHEDILQERKKMIKEGKAKYLSLEELKSKTR